MKSKLIIGCMLLGALSAKAQVQPITAAEYKEKVLEYSRQISKVRKNGLQCSMLSKLLKQHSSQLWISPEVINTV